MNRKEAVKMVLEHERKDKKQVEFWKRARRGDVTFKELCRKVHVKLK